MQTVPPEVWANFERRLDEARVPVPQRPRYHTSSPHAWFGHSALQ